jgi:fructokinase
MIVCCGEALIDMVPFRPDGSEGGEAYRPCPGGSPYNSAVAVGRLGVPVAFLGRISRDFFGESLVARLAANGVGTGLIARSGQPSTLAFVKLEEGEEPQYAFYTEGSADRSLLATDLPGELPEDARCILFGSISMTMEPAASTIEALVLKESGRRVISFDPNVRPVMVVDRDAYIRRMERWFKAATIVKISGADLEYLYPELGREAALERVLSFGASLLVTTLGEKGSLALGVRQDGARFGAKARGARVRVADTIGAGDSFHAAFLSWLEMNGKMSRTAVAALSEAELEEALLFANQAAALVCTRRGAEPPSLAELQAFARGEGLA